MHAGMDESPERAEERFRNQLEGQLRGWQEIQVTPAGDSYGARRAKLGDRYSIGTKADAEALFANLAALDGDTQQMIADELLLAWSTADQRGRGLNQTGVTTSPGAHRTISEMYRNAYESDAATLFYLFSLLDRDRAERIKSREEAVEFPSQVRERMR